MAPSGLSIPEAARLKLYPDPLRKPVFSGNSFLPMFLVADLSNSRTKIAPVVGGVLGDPVIIATGDLTGDSIREALSGSEISEDSESRILVASVVPERTGAFAEAFGEDRVALLTHESDLGIGIEFPDPSSIGPDRLANAAAVAALYEAPAVVVDFGTAVTFDIISAERAYVGGVIAPGLEAMTGYLHRRTALLPEIEIKEPPSAIGKSTEHAMLAGAVYGYRGLVREILREISRELEVEAVPTVATGGYADLIATPLEEIDEVYPNLTLEGIRIVGERVY